MSRGQRTPLYDEDTEAAEATEDALVRLVWRDGRLDEDEAQVVRLARRSVEASDIDAHAKRTALAILRCGEDSPRVIRLKRERPQFDPMPPAVHRRTA